MSRRRALRVAVIGQGFMGRAHGFGWARAAALEASRLTPELAVLCGRDRAVLAAHAELYGFASWSDDWAEVVGRDDVDLVDICTPGAAHAEMALAALAAGKHVLCEKPLANSLVEARHMAGAAQQAAAKGVFAMVGFNNRRVAAVAAARALVAEGRIGTLRHVRAVYLQGWLVDPLFPLTWRLDGAEAGSGALGDLLSHVVDLVRFLTGEEVDEVVSMLETFVRERPLGSSGAGLSATADREGRTGPVTVDDACAVLARLSGGALATLEATRMAPGSNNALVVELNGSRGQPALRPRAPQRAEAVRAEQPGRRVLQDACYQSGRPVRRPVVAAGPCSRLGAQLRPRVPRLYGRHCRRSPTGAFIS